LLEKPEELKKYIDMEAEGPAQNSWINYMMENDFIPKDTNEIEDSLSEENI
jgi:hypothetical protein